VTLAPTLFTPKNAKQGKKLFRCSDLSTGGEPARPALHRQHSSELQGSSPGPAECRKNNMPMKWANPRKPQVTAAKNAEIFNEAPVALIGCFLNTLPSSQHTKGQQTAVNPWE